MVVLVEPTGAGATDSVSAEMLSLAADVAALAGSVATFFLLFFRFSSTMSGDSAVCLKTSETYGV